jgi:AraC-like DNA-binding protein
MRNKEERSQHPIESWGFRSFLENPPTMLMESQHQHQEVELTYLTKGSVTYLFGNNTKVKLPAGRLAIFWATIPHKTIEKDNAGTLYVLNVPLPWLMQWKHRSELTEALLQGNFLIENDFIEEDLKNVARWHQDLIALHDEHRMRAAMLEMEARLIRYNSYEKIPLHPLRSKNLNRSGMDAPLIQKNSLNKVRLMAEFIANHSAEPIHVEDVAKIANIHPNYASTIFHQHTGMTILDYLTQYRIFHAQRLLTSANFRVEEVGRRCGFFSASRFYDIFRKSCGMSPARYRKSLENKTDHSSSFRINTPEASLLQKHEVQEALLS